MDRVDQGTLAMFVLAGVMILAAAVYFTLRWYWNQRPKSSATQKEKRGNLKKTFSRFSQVDEELTVHVFHEPSPSDRDLIQSYCEPNEEETPTTTPRLQMLSLAEPTEPHSPQISATRSSSHQRTTTSYLETDL